MYEKDSLFIRDPFFATIRHSSLSEKDSRQFYVIYFTQEILLLLGILHKQKP